MNSFKTKFCCAFLTMSLFVGGNTVLAAVTPDSDDWSNMTSATVLAPDQTVRVRLDSDENGEWYSFTPTQTNMYYFQADKVNIRNTDVYPYVDVYTQSGEQVNTYYCCSGINIYGNVTLTANRTYYIWASKIGQTEWGAYDMTIGIQPVTPDMTRMNTATPITMGQNYHVTTSESVGGQWFSFVPPSDDYYYFGTDNRRIAPNAYIFDSNGNLLEEADMRSPTGNLYYDTENRLLAGHTYYIWATTDWDWIDHGYDNSFDLFITWGGEIHDRTYVGERTYSNIIQGLDDITLDLVFSVDTSAISGNLTYQWYRYNFCEDVYEPISGATSNSLHTKYIGDRFRCVITRDGISRFEDFYLERHYEDSYYSQENGIAHSLADAGQTGYTVAPEIEGNVHYIGCNPWVDVTNFDVLPGEYNNVPVYPYSATSLDYVYAVDDYFGDSFQSAYLVAFVRTDANSASISTGQTQQVTLERAIYDEDEPHSWGTDYNRVYISDCKVYSFTPASSGTYTISSSDIVCGNPYVALFDSNYNFIARHDNIDGPSLEEEISAVSVGDKNFSLTQHLNGGETYYYVVWSSETIPEFRYVYPEVAQYNVTLTCDSLDTFNVRVTSGGHGSASSSASSGVPGTQVNLTATPDNGYHFVSWEVISGGVSISNNRITIGNSNVEIRANFAADPVIPQNTAPAVTETGVAGFVERLYTIALGRASDPVGKQDWIEAITLRGETGAGAARGFLFSDEFLNKGVSNEEFVATLYRTFFNREPDQAGFNAWVDVLNSGTSKQEVIEGFINSTEWANLCLFYGIRSGGTGVPSIEIEPNQQTIDFATRLYTTCLGRNADQNGLMAWARQLANQRDTGTGAARGFFFSSEFTGQNVSNGEYVTRLYRTFMNREPDQAGYDAWVGQLDSGISREEVFDGFAQSIEFARICAQYGIVR